MKNHDYNLSDIVAIVLCGGKGTRLQPLSYLIRKEMLPIGKTRKPVLEYIVEHLRRNGIREIVFLGSDMHGGDVANYFGDGKRFGVQITHQPDPIVCQGTGHALLWAIEKLQLQEKQLLVYYGDILSNVDLIKLIDNHHKTKAVATLALSDEYRVPKGIAEIGQDNILISFREKPKWPGPGKVGLGLLCIDTFNLIKLCEGIPTNEHEVKDSKFRDIMGDLIPYLIESKRVYSYITNSKWLDIGSFEDYSRVTKDVTWLIDEKTETHSLQKGLSIFLSYHINDLNKKLIEERLIPCLSAAGINVVSGGTLDRTQEVQMSPSHHFIRYLSSSDGVVGIVTPDKSDSSPSDWVFHEVSNAQGNKKLLGLFIQKGTNIPEPWKNNYTYTEFDMEDPAVLIRDVLLKLTKTVWVR